LGNFRSKKHSIETAPPQILFFPGYSLFSKIKTSKPAPAIRPPAANPAGPAPIITTSVFIKKILSTFNHIIIELLQVVVD